MNSTNRWRDPSGSRDDGPVEPPDPRTGFDPPLKPPRGRLALFFALLVALLACPLVGHAATPPDGSAVGDSRPTPLFDPGPVSQDPTLRLGRTFRLPGDPGEIRFLLANLDLACAVIRSWNLEKFRARRVRPNRYRAEDGAGMVGLLQVRGLSDTGAVVLGLGRYRAPALGWTLRGRAVARIRVQSDSPSQTTVRARIEAKVDNRVVHWVGRLLYPILRVLAGRKADHLIRVARRTLRVVHDHPDELKDRLEAVDPEYLSRWRQYPE